MYPDRAAKYRERAEELRIIAEDWKSDETRLMLQKVALDYERLAAGVERVAGASAPEAGTTVPNGMKAKVSRGSTEYQFRLLADGMLLLQYAQWCASDEDALRVPRQILSRRDSPPRLEVWQDDRCLYDGTPAGWPFVPLKPAHRAH